MNAPQRFDERERLARLRLSLTETIGAITHRRLIERYGSAIRVLEALPDLLRRGGRLKATPMAKASDAEKEAQSLHKIGARFLCLGEAGYPQALAAIEDAPPVLRVLGDAALLNAPSLAVVGARNASLNGQRFAESLAADLAQTGLVIVSGLARGIDTAAHRGALARGATVAVLAGGVDTIYPKENEALYRALAERGALVAERPFGAVPRDRDFPRRNRVIAGLSLGIVVVEAARRSGSLITARLALEQGREVFAVPGSPLDPRCEGTNDLLKQGAGLVTAAADVLDHLPTAIPARAPRGEGPALLPLPPPGPEKDSQTIEKSTEIVLSALGPAPLPVDELLRRCQLSPGDAATILLELELAGRIQRHPGNLVSLLEG